ncbi:hypothetical protein K474DRAFT_1713119 [Panus rudis PR-1116 ss-1]|nr:hypothetical protein K474DRAFT_1713119 [Panus rudis PR-1116 ss-1]
MSSNITAEVAKWKLMQFNPYDLRMDLAVESLKNPSTSKIEFKGYHPSRLNAIFRHSHETAVLTWAGIYAGGYHLDTGNLVPYGEKVPACVPENRAQQSISWKCAWTHSIDTTVDRSLYNMQTAIEDYLLQDPDFNPDRKPRRDYQNGLNPDLSQRYTFQTRMFHKRAERTQAVKDERKSKGVEWHPWIAQTIEENPSYYVNPDPPLVTEWRHGQFHAMKNCKPPYLQAGDVVWFSLKVTVHITSSSWWTEFIPEEIVRVMTVPEGVDPMGAPSVDKALRPRLAPGAMYAPVLYAEDGRSGDPMVVDTSTAATRKRGLGEEEDAPRKRSRLTPPLPTPLASPLTDWDVSDVEDNSQVSVSARDGDLVRSKV